MKSLLKVIILSLFSIRAGAQTANIVTNTDLYCTGSPITFSSSATSDLSYTWAVVPAKGLTSYTDLYAPKVTLTFSTTATYSIYLNYTDGSGVTRISYTTVTPGRSAQAAFNASLNSVGYPTELVLTNYSAFSHGNYWRFSDSTRIDSSLNLVRSYPKSGSYSVMLFTYGSKGCNDSSRYDFEISDFSSITLPNVFTPNGDGNNDVYKPLVKGISSLQAWVYNRDGIIVCSWDKPKSGWDGHSTSGEECSDGVYFIAVEALGFDGKTYKLKGTITLIR